MKITQNLRRNTKSATAGYKRKLVAEATLRTHYPWVNAYADVLEIRVADHNIVLNDEEVIELALTLDKAIKLRQAEKLQHRIEDAAVVLANTYLRLAGEAIHKGKVEELPLLKRDLASLIEASDLGEQVKDLPIEQLELRARNIIHTKINNPYAGYGKIKEAICKRPAAAPATEK